METFEETIPTRRSTGATGNIGKGKEGNVFVSKILPQKNSSGIITTN